jgi:mono/diheme cytochrome c family protein
MELNLYRRSAMVAAVALSSICAGAQSEPGANYTAKCQMCHGADGLANTPAGKKLGTRSFKLPEVVKESDEDLAGVIANGKNKMPKYTDKLSKSEIDALVAYIRQLQK